MLAAYQPVSPYQSLWQWPPTVTTADLPALNATLNTAAAIFLIGGLLAIKFKKVAVHATMMVLALVVSLAFLTSYLYYHYVHGHTPFNGEGTLLRTGYFAMLISHIVLAVVNVPLILITVTLAAKRNFAAHRKIARITYPSWLYVSVTGVLVYLMCYVWYPYPGPIKPGEQPLLHATKK